MAEIRAQIRHWRRQMPSQSAQPALIKRGWLALPLRGQGGLQGQARTCGGRAATAGAVGETATAGAVGNCECAAMRQAKTGARNKRNSAIC